MTAPTTPRVTDCTARVDDTYSHVLLCMSCDDCLSLYEAKMNAILPQAIADEANRAVRNGR